MKTPTGIPPRNLCWILSIKKTVFGLQNPYDCDENSILDIPCQSSSDTAYSRFVNLDAAEICTPAKSAMHAK
jgi:hypothetical protein